jgi:hypothetical protein
MLLQVKEQQLRLTENQRIRTPYRQDVLNPRKGLLESLTSLSYS